MAGPLGVLVVDDSELTRDALRRALERDPGLKVIGEARTGEEAIALARTLKPALITMDLAMPGIGGLKAIELILLERQVPVVVISERTSARGEDLNYEAMRRGAVELVPKHEVFGGRGDSSRRFATDMRMLAEAGLLTAAMPALRPLVRSSTEPPLLIGIGISTGGPRSLARFLSEMPARFPIPIAVVQHMAPDFFDSFVRFLAERSRLPVLRAAHGEKLNPGCVVLAPPGQHMEVADDLTVRLEDPDGLIHCPSVDRLFMSMAKSLHNRSLGLLMTGMGADGAEGLLQIKRVGGRTAIQDARSCAVFGMPQAALALGAVEEVVELENVSSWMTRLSTMPEARSSPPPAPNAPPPPPAPRTSVAPPKKASATGRPRILIVDDSRLMLEAGKLIFEDAGFDVLTLDNPLTLALVLRRESVDLVLLDVNMPAVKGPQVVEVLKSHGLNDLPVVLYSDMDEATLRLRAKECGASGALKKTGDIGELVRAVKGFLSRR